jgi:peptidylprolyl isomerase
LAAIVRLVPVTRHRSVLAAAAVLACLVLASCGDDDASAEGPAGETADAAETQPPPDQPDVVVPDDVPETLVVEDITEGSGAVVGAHDMVRVDYVGVSQSTGEQFDSSYGREPVEFSLDGVIPGWSEGLLGMKEGGRRQLVIPADMAYGDTPPPGSGIEAGEALVFVVDLLEVTVSYTDKPEVELPDEAPDDDLVIEDLEEGDGAEIVAAEEGTVVTVQYVGVSLDSGEEFDSSWDNGRGPVQFDITQVIPGWSEGLVGMKEGGRRRLIIPPDLGYGDDPPPGSTISAGDTLVFVVDLISVG